MTANGQVPAAPVDQAGLAAALRPFGESVMLPPAAYTDPAVFSWEQRHFLGGGWTCAGLSSQVPDPGDQRAAALGSGRRAQAARCWSAARTAGCGRSPTPAGTAGGVTISLRTVQPDVFFGPSYRRWTFARDYYSYSPYLAQAAFSMLPDSPFNETHTGSAAYNRWYAEANATFDPARRREVLHEMQEFDFTRGGYIIPASIGSLDAYSTKITGYTAARAGQPLSNFDFEHFAFAG
jgi:ABC-type transport system substrate-binding protein